MNNYIFSGHKSCRVCEVEFEYSGGQRLCTECLKTEEARLTELRGTFDQEHFGVLGQLAIGTSKSATPASEGKRVKEVNKIQKIRQKWLSELEGKEVGSNVVQCLGRYVLYLIERNLSCSHISHTESRIRFVIYGCGWNEVGEITQESSDAWINATAYKDATKSGYKAVVSSFRSWLKSEEEEGKPL